MLMTINELLINSIITFTNIFLIDMFLICWFGRKARWFQLHAFINFIITACVLDDTISIISNPNINMYLMGDRKPGYYAICIHIYHIIAFKKINNIDYVHHLLSAFIGGVPAHLYYSSKLLNFGYFFGCGIPGGITYFMLVLVKHNKMSKIKEKKITAYINAYIRCPGILTTSILEYLKYKSNLSPNEYSIVQLLIIIIGYWNSCFFNYDAIYNFAINDRIR